MQIKDVVLKKIDIPFTVAFKHASADRTRTHSVLVEMMSGNGLIGYGESCPRGYVTAEDLDTVRTFFNNHIDAFTEQVNSMASLIDWMRQNETKIDSNPAAMCAIEMAFLDLLAKNERVSMERLLDLPELTGQFNYTAVIGDSGPEIFDKILQKYLQMGFVDYKIKLSGDLARDQEKCRIITRAIKSPVRLRFDANNLWDDLRLAINYLSKLEVDYFAIEEPLVANNYSDLSKLSLKLDKQIILDESFLRLGQMQALLDNPDVWVINLRVSKMGGLLRSKKIIDRAKRNEIKIIIGAQVGETSLLTRAALTIANYAKDVVIAQEGAFGNLLLKQDLCEPPIMFGKHGILESCDVPTSRYGCGFNPINHEAFGSIN